MIGLLGRAPLTLYKPSVTLLGRAPIEACVLRLVYNTQFAVSNTNERGIAQTEGTLGIVSVFTNDAGKGNV